MLTRCEEFARQAALTASFNRIAFRMAVSVASDGVPLGGERPVELRRIQLGCLSHRRDAVKSLDQPTQDDKLLLRLAIFERQVNHFDCKFRLFMVRLHHHIFMASIALYMSIPTRVLR